MASTRLIFTLTLIVISINQFNGGRLQVRSAFFLKKKSQSLELQDHFYLDYLLCKFNPKMAVNGTCKLSFINRLEKSMSVSSFVTKPLDDIMGRVQLLYKFRSGYKPLLINVTCNVCDFLKGKVVDSLLFNMIMPKLQVYSARKFMCPHQGLFSIQKMPINMGVVDYLFIPAGSYMLNLTLSVKKELLWNGEMYFILPEGKTAEDDRMG